MVAAGWKNGQVASDGFIYNYSSTSVWNHMGPQHTRVPRLNDIGGTNFINTFALLVRVCPVHIVGSMRLQ